ncbi:MAG: recombinase RecA [Candidatus Auribacter fodinae]|uniref:Protein RecA n=1 Tax=Candidatus Auribacter fodinae TaxID=2093366 RepID=A0A3A4R273_9BACT|nr:MAG: recombinase RecA [Candidatus Auribacter fodinae]
MANKTLEPKTDKMLDTAIEQIEKQFGKGSIMRLGQRHVANIPVISTGAYTLDEALGVGGVPRSRIVEIYGAESSGKTTLALHIVANAQKAGGMAAYIDAEHAVDPAYAKKIGVDVDNLLISQPDCGEDALNIVEMLVKSNAIDVIVVDSVAALVPKSELEGDIGDSFMGLQARLMSQALRKITSIVGKSKTCCIFINQVREKIGIVYGNPTTTTGGRALKFYASVRLEIKRTGNIKDNQGNITGSRTSVKVAKNKVAPPFMEAEFDIIFSEGISYAGSVLDVAVQKNLIQRKGTWFSFGDTRLGQGREAAKKEIQDKPELLQQVLEKLRNSSINGSLSASPINSVVEEIEE